MVFSKLFGKNDSKKRQRGSDSELKNAAALLMYKMIRSDGVADALERIHFKETLRKEFKLQQSELDELLEYTQQADIESLSVEQLCQEIRDNCGNAKRIKILEYLWILAFVDDRVDKREAAIVKQVAELLYLSDAEITRAQEGAENTLGMGF